MEARMHESPVLLGKPVVMDTNVLISATLFEGSLAQKLLAHLFLSNAPLFTSKRILSEYEHAIKRDFIEKRGLKTLVKRLPFLLSKLNQLLINVEPAEKVQACRDSADNAILECAIASSSGFIVTFDPDLLDMKIYRGIKIVHPLEMLRMLQKK